MRALLDAAFEDELGGDASVGIVALDEVASILRADVPPQRAPAAIARLASAFAAEFAIDPGFVVVGEGPTASARIQLRVVDARGTVGRPSARCRARAPERGRPLDRGSLHWTIGVAPEPGGQERSSALRPRRTRSGSTARPSTSWRAIRPLHACCSSARRRSSRTARAPRRAGPRWARQAASIFRARASRRGRGGQGPVVAAAPARDAGVSHLVRAGRRGRGQRRTRAHPARSGGSGPAITYGQVLMQATPHRRAHLDDGAAPPGPARPASAAPAAPGRPVLEFASTARRRCSPRGRRRRRLAPPCARHAHGRGERPGYRGANAPACWAIPSWRAKPACRPSTGGGARRGVGPAQRPRRDRCCGGRLRPEGCPRHPRASARARAQGTAARAGRRHALFRPS